MSRQNGNAIVLLRKDGDVHRRRRWFAPGYPGVSLTAASGIRRASDERHAKIRGLRRRDHALLFSC